MYILKNAWTSITRNKGRNILIGLIVMVLATSSTITLAISNSANNLIQSYEDSYETTATISVNRESFMGNFKPGEDKEPSSMVEEFQNIESLTVEDIKNYGSSEYVSSYTYTESIGVNASDLEKATTETGRGGGRNEPTTSSTDFTLTGYSSEQAMSEFLSGTYTISEGSISSDFTDSSCIINEELATLNELEVGDTIKIVNPNNTSKTYTLTITGIYKDSSESGGMNLFSNSVNTIITNTTVLEKIYSDDSTLNMTVNPTFYLTSSDVIEDFESDLTQKGLSEYYSVSTNLDEAESALSSISNLKTFSITFLIITLLIGAIVLFVLNMINVRERKYEIGVLRTIGMKKVQVASQFICELLIVSFASLVIGLGIGSVSSVPTANMLLQNEIESSETKMNEVANNFGGRENAMEGGMDRGGKGDFKVAGVANIEKVTSIDVVVDFKVVLELLGVGILLTLISSMASVVSIMRFSPLTILKERS